MLIIVFIHDLVREINPGMELIDTKLLIVVSKYYHMNSCYWELLPSPVSSAEHVQDSSKAEKAATTTDHVLGRESVSTIVPYKKKTRCCYSKFFRT
jgi:hypothetical protein